MRYYHYTRWLVFNLVRHKSRYAIPSAHHHTKPGLISSFPRRHALSTAFIDYARPTSSHLGREETVTRFYFLYHFPTPSLLYSCRGVAGSVCHLHPPLKNIQSCHDLTRRNFPFGLVLFRTGLMYDVIKSKTNQIQSIILDQMKMISRFG